MARVQVEVSEPNSPVRGRPRQFDRGEVLDQLVDLFWERGFEATAMSDIVATTGLNKSSLYATFGSKDELFAEALARYVSIRGSMLQQFVVGGTRGLDDIAGLLDMMQAETAASGGARGCLAANCTTELGLSERASADLLAEFRDTMRQALRAALDRAAASGEIHESSVATYAEVFLVMWLGLAVATRGQGNSSEVQGQFDAMRELLQSWRLPSYTAGCPRV